MLRDGKGKFVKGVSNSPATQFKPGQHWRQRKPYWEREWLRCEYEDRGRSAADIAGEFCITEGAILFWLRKHAIPTRSMSSIRKQKHWGAEGQANPMYGKRGAQHPNWKGGLTPVRQRLYSTIEWRRAARRVRDRDRRSCRVCHAKGHTDIHHIIPFRVAPLLAIEEGNLILLCKECHRKADNNWKRWADKLLTLIRG